MSLTLSSQANTERVKQHNEAVFIAKIAADSNVSQADLLIASREISLEQSSGSLWDERFEGSGYEETWSAGESLGSGSTIDEDADPADVSSPSRWGSQCLKVTTTGEYAYVEHAPSWTDTYLHLEMVFTSENMANGESNLVFWAWGPSGSGHALGLQLDQDSSGQLRLAGGVYDSDNTGSATWTYTNVSLNTRYVVEFEFNPTSNEWEYKLDGTLKASGALTGTHATGIGKIRLGSHVFGTTSTSSLTAYYDMVLANSSGHAIESYSGSLLPLDQGGLSFQASRLKTFGGLGIPGNFQVRVRNEGQQSNAWLNAHYLANDVVETFLLFIDGAEDTADLVPLRKGIIRSVDVGLEVMTLNVEDNSDEAFVEMPQEKINIIDHPDAPLENFGKVIPRVFGIVNSSPNASDGLGPFLAPAIMTDIFTNEYTTGRNNDSQNEEFEYYPEADWFGACINVTQTGDLFTIDSNSRIFLIHAGRPYSSNDVTDWKQVADRDNSTFVSITNGDNLDVAFRGLPELGLITAVSGIITIDNDPNGDFDFEWFEDTTSKASGTGVSGNQSDALAITDWNFQQVRLEMDGIVGTDPDVAQVHMQVTFDAKERTNLQPMLIFQQVVGFEDLATEYRDGAVVNTSGNALENCVDVLEAIFRAKFFLHLPVAEVNTASFNTAFGDRLSYNAAFVLDRPIAGDGTWFDAYAREFLLDLFRNQSGQWTVKALEESPDPEHTFTDNALAVVNPDAPAQDRRADFRLHRVSTDEIRNDFVYRYQLNRAKGEHNAIEERTSRYRVNGTDGTVTASTNRLVDTGATFQTDGVQVGDNIVIGDGSDNAQTTVSSVDSETQITAASFTTDLSEAKWWIGPNLDQECLDSREKHKVARPLGQRFDVYSRQGGYLSNLVGSSVSAALIADKYTVHMTDTWLRVTFSTFLNACNVELGDVCLFDHEWIPESHQGTAIGITDEALDTIETGIDVATGTGSSYTVNEYYRVGTTDEIVKVSSISTDTLTVARAAAGSTVRSHALGVTLFHITKRWRVTELQPVPARAQFKITLQELPE